MKSLRFIFLLLFTVVFASADEPFENEIRAFEKSDALAPPPKDGALFIGSSSFRMWKNMDKDFPEIPVINRGFGGAHISDCVRYVPRIVTPYHPRVVFLYAGGNDLNSGKSVDTVVHDFSEFVKAVHAANPKQKIAYVASRTSIARWAQRDAVKQINDRIAAVCQKNPLLHFIDSNEGFLNEKGEPKKEFLLEDNLHLNAVGYAWWAKVLHQPAVDYYNKAGK